ncbi:6541_t:CDS:2, partial [Entrophospora sp. SA101]
MNNHSNNNNKYMCMEVGYDDPDKEYETLDDDTYTDNFSIPTSSTMTSLINTDQNSYCIDFNEESLSNIENDIDWLSSDFDVQSDVGSLWTSTIDEFEDSVHMLSEEKKTINDNDRCVIVDLVNGKLQRCKNTIFRPLHQLLGIWELDFDEVNKAIKVNQPDATALLGTCSSHYSFDNKNHLLHLKNSVPTHDAWIYKRRCLFCNYDKFYYSRGDGCTQHSKSVLERNVHVPCCGLKVCPVFVENIFVGRGVKALHTYIEDHNEDNSKSLKLFGECLQNISTSSDQIIKNLLLEELSVSLSKFFKRKQLLQTQPTSISDGKSLLLKHQFDKIQIILLHEVEEKFLFQVVNAFYKAKFFINTINITHEEQLKDIFYQLSIKGIFAVILIKKDSALNHNVNMKIYKHQYQDTTKYDEYDNIRFEEAVKLLSQFRENLLDSPNSNPPNFLIFKTALRLSRVNLKKLGHINQYIELIKNNPKELGESLGTVIWHSRPEIFAFPGINFWLNYVMSSLCRRKKLQESLYAMLCMANVISHTQRHERKLAMKRANELDISGKLIRNNENIWNLCVMDNIDFQEKTFGHSFHVGMSTFTEKEIEHFENTFSLLWNLYGRDFDVAQVQEELWKNVEIGCLIEPPNVIILKPGEDHNNTMNIHAAARIYYDDIGLDSTGHLDLSSDESIFRKLNKLNESETEIRLLLDLLLSEFVGDKIKTPTKRNIKSQKDALWKLITDLEKAFEHSNKSILTPEVPELFKGAIECSNQGFQKLYNSYDIGINRSNDIFKQDIERSVVQDTTGKNNNECEYKDEYKKYTGECKTQ